ncbi:MobF family relaxase [Emticicia fontis]
MIRMIQNSNVARARSYFTESLSRGDYYLDSQERPGKIMGKLAERIGIVGSVTKDIFSALCLNKNPLTGRSLSPRFKEGRTIFYDCSFHAVKSISILHALSNDDHLQNAFEKSVRATMKDIERDSKTRVRLDGQDTDRNTGELLWAEFTHLTARPIDGSLPDPHLHCHVTIFNNTWDEKEQRIKAAQFRDIKRDMPYYQACFQKRLSDELIKLGYQIRPTKSAFEIVGIPPKVISLFSKRTDEIGRFAQEKGITSEKELDQLGARTRSSKQKGHTMSELKAEWKRQINELYKNKEEKDKDNQTIRFAKTDKDKAMTPQQYVDYAVLKGFERASVIHDRRLMAEAILQSIGNEKASVRDIEECFKNDTRLIHIEDQGKIKTTTRQVLQEESRMVKLAQKGIGIFKPLYTSSPETSLMGQQKDAVDHVLTNTNQVSIIRGVAGSGKTSTLKELVSLIEKVGKTVTMVAPSAHASRGVLREEGFAQADTVAKLLEDKKSQDTLENQVLIVDEAGLLGTKDMNALLELAKEQNARLILLGDTRQHASVVRGDALRILNSVAKIETAEMTQIFRQRTEDYRNAVEDLAKGEIKSAFEKLNKLEVIKAIDPLQPHQALIEDYIDVVKKGKSALVISPTHKQIDQVNEAIREKLKSEKLIGKKDIEVTRLQNLNLTEAEKGVWTNFEPGQVVQFNQNLPQIKRGSIWVVEACSQKEVTIRNDKETCRLPVERSSHFDIYRKSTINLSKGETIKITRNGFDKEKKRLDNSDVLKVISVSKDGKIQLQNTTSKAKYELDKDFGHIAHAYCMTSHSSQGRTVDEVFISQPASTFSATDAKQMYVSVSRGRDRARIYTDDKEQLLEHAAQMGDRQSAMELVQSSDKGDQIMEQYIRQSIIQDKPDMNKDNKSRATRKEQFKTNISYEPEI